jgi:hypothetical protein
LVLGAAVDISGEKTVQRPAGAHQRVNVTELKTVGEHEHQLIWYPTKAARPRFNCVDVNSSAAELQQNTYLLQTASDWHACKIMSVL